MCNVLFVQVREAAGALLKNSKDFVLLEPLSSPLVPQSVGAAVFHDEDACSRCFLEGVDVLDNSVLWIGWISGRTSERAKQGWEDEHESTS